MSYKVKAIDELSLFSGCVPETDVPVIRDCIKLLEGIPEEERENITCSKPNFEGMYHKVQEELEKAKMLQSSMENEIKELRFANVHLCGFKEAIELVYVKGRAYHECTNP